MDFVINDFLRNPHFSKFSKFKDEMKPYVVKLLKSTGARHCSRTSEEMDGTLPRIASFENT